MKTHVAGKFRPPKRTGVPSGPAGSPYPLMEGGPEVLIRTVLRICRRPNPSITESDPDTGPWQPPGQPGTPWTARTATLSHEPPRSAAVTPAARSQPASGPLRAKGSAGSPAAGRTATMALSGPLRACRALTGETSRESTHCPLLGCTGGRCGGCSCLGSGNSWRLSGRRAGVLRPGSPAGAGRQPGRIRPQAPVAAILPVRCRTGQENIYPSSAPASKNLHSTGPSLPPLCASVQVVTLRCPADSDSSGDCAVLAEDLLTLSAGMRNISEEAAVRLPRRKPAVPVQREVTPLAMYRAGRVDWPGPEVTPLELYGAQQVPDLGGWWVYAFSDPGPGGKVWYAGQTDRLWSRWRDHYYKFGARFTAATKWVMPVENEAVADLRELVLINFYEPEMNDKGRAEDLSVKVHKWLHGTRQFQPNGARWHEGLDPSQGSARL